MSAVVRGEDRGAVVHRQRHIHRNIIHAKVVQTVNRKHDVHLIGGCEEGGVADIRVRVIHRSDGEVLHRLQIRSRDLFYTSMPSILDHNKTWTGGLRSCRGYYSS